MISKKRITLRPMGGLCNRLRAIDSFIDICKKYNYELFVLWTLDVTLNSSFYNLFEEFEIDNLSIKIIDCPSGFPEQNLIKFGKSSHGDYAVNLNELTSSMKNRVKQLLYFKNLDSIHKLLLSELKTLSFNQVITNDSLEVIYNSESNQTASIRELDSTFFPKVKPVLINKISADRLLYVSCCYRVLEMTSFYQYLQPKQQIKAKIDLLASEFGDNSIGLHVRRTDHVASKSLSTNDKFKKVVEKEINSNDKVKFYLSTDDPNFKDEFILEYPNRIITNEIESYDRNSSSAIQDAVVDLFCLSKTNFIYGSHQSSFSQTAADIGLKKEIIV